MRLDFTPILWCFVAFGVSTYVLAAALSWWYNKEWDDRL